MAYCSLHNPRSPGRGISNSLPRDRDPESAHSGPENVQHFKRVHFFGALSSAERKRTHAAANATNLTGQVHNNRNYALQDYQTQLKMLEQENKKRMLIIRREQEIYGDPVA